MAAVPTGPSGALAASPVSVIPFPGDGCAVPGEGDKLVIKTDSIISSVGQENEAGECKRERERRLFSDIHPHCPTLERQVNGSSCFGKYDDRSLEELRLAVDRCDKRAGAAKNGSTGADVPLEQLARLGLNHSVLRDAEPSEEIKYVRYESELQMPGIMRLITKDLSEPYSIYTYRYFIHNWPRLCFLAMVEEECVGAIVCKLDMHKKMFRRGYIAMLAVDSKHRRKSIGTNLVKKAIYAMVEGDCDEVVLETEITNKSALKLYENLGFVRDKRLFRYYLNGVDALRLKLWLR
ncbi:N-alpha-acetyltransferase 30-like [Brachyhypopomus gauderio]|uniref:N-alpha-acetyltransferase 30-like n=1 Tax=Brachyhypopomus gauderio TaxID=698409 RepID=UPI0040413FF6